MAKPTILTQDDASVTTLVSGNVHILFDCGVGGGILAARGINFSRLKLPDVNQGKIIKASTKSGAIVIDHLGADAKHTTLIGLDKTIKTPDELHIRVPIGVCFFETDTPRGGPAGYARAFFFQTSDGYNIIPHFLPLRLSSDPQYDAQQMVQELILITSHVPPRRGHINDRDTQPIPHLSSGEVHALKTSDVPPPERPKRGN
jgi:hypothetical protein